MPNFTLKLSKNWTYLAKIFSDFIRYFERFGLDGLWPPSHDGDFYTTQTRPSTVPPHRYKQGPGGDHFPLEKCLKALMLRKSYSVWSFNGIFKMSISFYFGFRISNIILKRNNQPSFFNQSLILMDRFDFSSENPLS